MNSLSEGEDKTDLTGQGKSSSTWIKHPTSVEVGFLRPQMKKLMPTRFAYSLEKDRDVSLEKVLRSIAGQSTRIFALLFIPCVIIAVLSHSPSLGLVTDRHCPDKPFFFGPVLSVLHSWDTAPAGQDSTE